MGIVNLWIKTIYIIKHGYFSCYVKTVGWLIKDLWEPMINIVWRLIPSRQSTASPLSPEYTRLARSHY